MSSKSEYKGTLGLPYEFQFEDGPRMARMPLVYIEGGAVVYGWRSESGNTVLTYRLPADEKTDYLGRTVALSSRGTIIPPEGCMGLAEMIFPDETAGGMGIETDEPVGSLGIVGAPLPLRATAKQPLRPVWN